MEAWCFKCKTGYTLQNGACKKQDNSCSATTKEWYEVSALNNNQTKTVNRNITYWQCQATAKCTNGTVSISNESCCADSIKYGTKSITVTACYGWYDQSKANADAITIADRNV
jgi:hypothetical protein